MTDLRQQGEKKNENVYSLISSGPTFCFSPLFRFRKKDISTPVKLIGLETNIISR